MHPRRRRLATILVAAGAAAACTDGDPRPTATPSPTVVRPPVEDVYRGRLVGVQTLPWSEAVVVDDRTLDLLYVAGVQDCRRLANVRVAEAPAQVTVTIFEGTLPSSEREACPAMGRSARVRVTLTSPLGTRRLLDGDAKPPAERPVRR